MKIYKIYPLLFLLGWLMADATRGTMNKSTPIAVLVLLLVQIAVLVANTALNRRATPEGKQHEKSNQSYEQSSFDVKTHAAYACRSTLLDPH